jgi:hypothetical protein
MIEKFVKKPFPILKIGFYRDQSFIELLRCWFGVCEITKGASSKLILLLVPLVVTVAILSMSPNAYAVVYTPLASGDWNDPATWEGGTVPGPSDSVIIPSGF